ncbi:MAG: GMC family oxidoreductase [Robiginitomaculum sp.]|nr:MAG: GMC family oxidoreductase [Robiginitomaculum sp.]
MSDFDAIVVGSGMSGGWVAKELCERGLKVLMLERGYDIDPAEDYSDNTAPWEEKNYGDVNPEEVAKHYFVQKNVYAFNEQNKNLWVKDDEHPYETPEGRPYQWYRGFHLGGRSLMWARQSYRWSQLDFGANKKDGHGVEWPIGYEDLKSWYDYVETFAGISGTTEGLPQLPDGNFLPPYDLTCAEDLVKERVEKAFPGRNVIPGRVANLRQATEAHNALGRGSCQVRDRCFHGCSFGAYFSSNSATLPAARLTGNLTIKTDSIVDSLDYDPVTKKISGVRVVDRVTKAKTTYTSKIVFLNASTIPTSSILLNSKSEAFPTGLANSSDQVGRNLMDHVSGGRATGIMREKMDMYHSGRRPNGFYVPRYVNLEGEEQEEDFVRGFGYQGRAYRSGWGSDKPGIGQDFKDANRTPGPWVIAIVAFAEILPNPNNRVSLHGTKTDQWGSPIPIIDAVHGKNEEKLIAQAARDSKAMFEAAGVEIIRAAADEPLKLSIPGQGIHEMGTARMGLDPKTSVLNKWGQSHDVSNLFISDGACMTSSACQNPSLTYMALSARAAHHAADLLEAGEL